MSTITPPRNAPSVEQLNIARKAARRQRAEWLAEINSGMFTIIDLLNHAATDDGQPLRAIKLRDLLLAEEDMRTSEADRRLAALRALLKVGQDMPVFKMTVGWLLDNRTNGQRFDAFLDALQPARTVPWDGFPFTVAPMAGLAR